MSDTHTTAASAVNMRELLALPSEAVERPKGIPDGHYLAEIISHEFGQTSKTKTDFVRFVLGRLEPTADVVEDVSEYDFNRIELRVDFFITPRAFLFLVNALDNVLGKQPGVPQDARIPEMTGARVQVLVTRRLNEDGTDSGFNNVDGRTMVAAD